MTTKLFQLIGTFILLGAGALANAASVSLVATTPTQNVSAGDTVSFDVVIDFTDVGGTLGGGFDVVFDDSQLSFVSLVSGPVGTAFGKDPTVLAGLLKDWAAGDFNGIMTGVIGSFSLEVLPGATSSLVALGPTSGIAGPWVSNVTFQPLDPQPDYNSVQVSAAVVPVPAAAWLFGSGLLGLAGVARRSRRA